MNACRASSPMARRARVWRLVIGGLALGWAAAGCRDEAAAAAAATQWRWDSTRYEAELAKYLRDSLVIDSIARTVDTDSLRQLYRMMLYAEDPMPVLREVLCQRARLAARYGLSPSEIAIRRLRATVWRPEERDAVRAMEDRMPERAVLSFDPSCSEGPRAPYTLNGTPLQTLFMRPVPPRRPRRFSW
jgi:hypothetical protein